jgi:hypothetical protein
MKRNHLLAAAGALLVCAVAYAAVEKKALTQLFSGGIIIGNTGTKIDDSYSGIGLAVYDFPSVTDQCDLTPAIVVTGAALNDVCSMSRDVAEDENSWYTCQVTAANEVKVKHCSHGAINPADAGYTVRVFDP